MTKYFFIFVIIFFSSIGYGHTQNSSSVKALGELLPTPPTAFSPTISYCMSSHIIKIITKQLFYTKKMVGLRSSDIAPVVLRSSIHKPINQMFSNYLHSAGMKAAATLLISAGIALTGCSKDITNSTPTGISKADKENNKGINKVEHVIVIYMENHSFDNLYGSFPGANGLSDATRAQYTQLDTATGLPYTVLPWSDPSFVPTPTLPNAPYDIGSMKAPSVITRDLVHRFYQEQNQIDGGKMDRFAAISDAKGLSMGYYQTSQLPLLNVLGNDYTLCDNFFHSAFGGSFLNHMWLIAARTPQWTAAPASMFTTLDAKGNPIADKNLTPDGYVVNTSFTVNAPHPATAAANTLVPNLTFPTIGDELTLANVSWAWYSGGWNDALAGHPGSLFQFHHQPFAYFANYADGTAAKTAHLKDEVDFNSALADGSLPAVSFLKPYGINNEHPGYTDVITGENYLADLVARIKASPIWKDCVVIITYDEHGGFWDHVAPPVIDRWGPGARVPGIIISPFCSKKGNNHVDHTQYETASILSFIEKRWNLAPLSTRDAAADPLSNALKWE
jgi:phospholipase C